MGIVRSLKRKILTAEIVLGLAFARALIKLVPFRWWKKTLGPIDGSASAATHQLSELQQKKASDIGRIVKRLAGKQKFAAVCFPQAIATRWILARRGIPSEVVLGSRRADSDSGIALHAWLKVGNEVVTGQDEYAAFTSFSSKTRKGTPH